MTKSILLVLHGSTQDSSNIEVAINWARRSDASVRGLAIIDKTVSEPDAVPIGGGQFKDEKEAELLLESEQLAETIQEALSKRCQAAQIHFSFDQVKGVPHELVSDQVQRHDLAVIENLAGNNNGAGESPAETLKLLTKSLPRPIISAPREYREGNSILVAFDGSTSAAKALFGLVGSGLSSLAPVRLITVDAKSESSAEERAAQGLEYFRIHGIETDFQAVVSDGSVAELICDEAERHSSDLLVAGCHVRRKITDVLMGSITREIVTNASVPVFLYG